MTEITSKENNEAIHELKSDIRDLRTIMTTDIEKIDELKTEIKDLADKKVDKATAVYVLGGVVTVAMIAIGFLYSQEQNAALVNRGIQNDLQFLKGQLSSIQFAKAE